MSLLLPLLLGPKTQDEAMISGIEHITHLIRLYSLREELYLSPVQGAGGDEFRSAVVDLYSHILEYQARLLWHLSKRSFKRAIRNMAQLDRWKEWLEAIKKYDRSCNDFTDIIDMNLERSNLEQQNLLAHQQTDLQRQMIEMFQAAHAQLMSDNQRIARKEFLQSISADYVAYKNNLNPRRVPGTCQWFLEDERFHTWRDRVSDSVLFVSAGPGCGKSVLSRALIDERLVTNLVATSNICYFFFKDGLTGQQTGTDMLKALLHQLFSQNTDPDVISFALRKHELHGDKVATMFDELWDILTTTARLPGAGEIVCVIDALDECKSDSRDKLLKTLTVFFSDVQESTRSRLKILITSRPYNEVVLEFMPLHNHATFVHFHGAEKTRMISQEINLVIDNRLEAITPRMKAQDRDLIAQHLMETQNRTYLWLHLALDFIKVRFRTQRTSKQLMPSLIKGLPSSINQAYERVLDKINGEIELGEAKTIFQLVIAAKRPLTIVELQVAFKIAQTDYGRLAELRDEFASEEVFTEILNDLCGLLLVVYESRVYFIHQTAREYLLTDTSISRSSTSRWESSISLQEAEHVFTMCCLRMLFLEDLNWDTGLDEFIVPPNPIYKQTLPNEASSQSSGDESLTFDSDEGRGSEVEEGTHQFLLYAAATWVEHYRYIDSDVDPTILSRATDLCRVSTKKCHLWTALWVESRELYAWRRKQTKQAPILFSDLEVAVFCGLPSVVKTLLDSGANYFDLLQIRPLSGVPTALVAGATLITRDDFDVEDFQSIAGNSTCTLACMLGDLGPSHSELKYETILNTLLDRGLDIDITIWSNNEQCFTTLLVLACRWGYDSLACRLVENGAKLNFKGGCQPLEYAAANCQPATVRLLDDRWTKINSGLDEHAKEMLDFPDKNDENLKHIRVWWTSTQEEMFKAKGLTICRSTSD